MKSNIIVALLLCSNLVADMVFEEWHRRENQAFTNYQTQQDRAFVEMLKREWQECNAVQTPIPNKKPKPIYQPIFSSQPKPQEIINITPLPQIVPTPKPPQQKDILFDFFAIDVGIDYDKRLQTDIDSISPLGISQFWNKNSSANYQPLINQIKKYQQRYSLDGWTTYLLVQKITKEITTTQNSQTLLSWFLLVKLGIDAKVGFASNTISLLIHSREKIYGVKFFLLNGKKYYSFNAQKRERLKIYKADIDSLYAMIFLEQKSKIPLDIKNREIRFAYQKREYRLHFPYNNNLIKLYKTYPQLNYNRYTKLSILSQEFISKRLKGITSNMNRINAINFLLRLTQNGFRYKTDSENFGHEKVMFFEETLHYQYSDCEDRAIFFAMLVEKLLKLDLVFIKYPNHLATAIRLNSDIGGDKIIYNNKRYYIADPTYSSANIGQAMPQLKGQEIKIIKGKI